MDHKIGAWHALLIVSLTGTVISLYTDSVGAGLLAIATYLFARFAAGLIKRRFGVDLLMGAAAFVTWYLGSYFEGYLIIALYSLSEIIEEFAEGRALRTLSSLKDLIPRSVNVLDNGGIRGVPPEDVDAGDIVLVRRGEAVVVDGVLADEAGVFDTSIMTGEQEPVRLVKGDRVLSGYINLGDPVKVRAVASFRGSALRVLVAEALRALEGKSRVQRFLEKISPPYTAALLGGYAATALIIGPYRALPIILAGCPSAFIVTSATMTAATIARLAKRGVVIRGGVVLEKASRIGVVVLDKTGTVTTGKLRVASVEALDGFTENEVLRLAGGAAKGSIHPLSLALSGHSNLTPESVREVPGMGVEARVMDRLIRLGNKRFTGFEGPGCGDLTPVYVSVDGRPAGMICLEEEVDEGVRKMISELRKAGVRAVLASGDKERKVSSIAEGLGITEFYSGMTPQEKAALIKRLRMSRGPVAMIGDGINDAVALAEADLGVAVGQLSLTASVADAVLVSGPSLFLDLIREAGKYRTAIIAGFAAAAVIKAVALALGFAGAVPMAAVVALGDDGSTLFSLALASAIMRGH